MTKKIVIVGASHPAHEAAIDLFDRYSDVDVHIYEADHFISFMSCGMKLFLEGKTTGQDDVRNFAPADIEKLGGHVHADSQVVGINPIKKEVTVKTLNGEDQVSYDKLILTVGVYALSLDVPGKELDNLLLMRGYESASQINAAIHNPEIKDVVVIGAGNGISAVEALGLAGKNVTLIDTTDRPLDRFMNPEMIPLVEKELKDQHVNVMMNTLVQGFSGNGKVEVVKTNKGDVKADLVIETVGIKPNTEWLKDIIDLDDRGFIEVDNNFRTSGKDIYAVGDAIWPFSIPANTKMPIPSAVAARHEAKYLAEHIFEEKPITVFKGLVGAQVLDLFSLHGFTTGITAQGAKFAGIDADCSYYEDRMRPKYIPEKDNPMIHISITYNRYSHQILGANVISKVDISGIGSVFSLAIGQKMTLEELADQDFFFSPSYDKQWNYVNLACQHALGLRDFD